MTIKKFIKKWHGKEIEDLGGIMSPEAKQFYRDMRTLFKSEFAKKNIKIVDFSINHYDMSCFVEKDGNYVYISHDISRYSPQDLCATDWIKGFLYRTAENSKDYYGGTNQFCCLESLFENVNNII